MGFDWNLSKAIGKKPEWNEIWKNRIIEKNLKEFSVSDIEKQYEKEWESWIKDNPEKSRSAKKCNLLWEKAITNWIDQCFKTDFIYLFGSWLIPYITKSKTHKIVVDGYYIELFLDEVRKKEGMISYSGVYQDSFQFYIEFLTRGMEKGIFSA